MNSRCQSTSPILTSIAFGVAAFALVFAPSAAFAQESGYYANGKFHKLIQSETEFAVEFEDAGQRQTMGETMRANSSMEIVDVPWDHNPNRFAILKGKRLDHAAQARLRGSRSIKALRNVYRLSEDSEPILSSGKIVVKFKSNVSDAERDVNNSIANDFEPAMNIRLGGEFAYEIFRFRAGLGIQQSPFANDNSTNKTYSAGFGIRQQNFSLDFAYRLHRNEELFIPYQASDSPEQLVANEENFNTFAFTVGFRF